MIVVVDAIVLSAIREACRRDILKSPKAASAFRYP
jgi:hypothetical protein